MAAGTARTLGGRCPTGCSAGEEPQQVVPGEHPDRLTVLHHHQRVGSLQRRARLLVERGYDGATTRRIAERAGISLRLIYHHFGDLVGRSAQLVSRTVGSPGTWPASWLFALREHRPPDQYDVLVGRYLFYRQNNLGGRLAVGSGATTAIATGDPENEGTARFEPQKISSQLRCALIF